MMEGQGKPTPVHSVALLKQATIPAVVIKGVIADSYSILVRRGPRPAAGLDTTFVQSSPVQSRVGWRVLTVSQSRPDSPVQGWGAGRESRLVQLS